MQAHEISGNGVQPVPEYSFERYLNVGAAYGASFSPDGQQLTFLTDITGVAEVWSVPVDLNASAPRPRDLPET